ncbi:MAG TPA: FAD-binding protein, partial [Ilumatobacteraceae bacterium]
MRAVVPVRDGVLPAGGAETVAECGGAATLIGSRAVDAARELGGIATELTVIERDHFAAAEWAAVLAGHLAGEAHIVLPASPDGRDLAPRLAAALRRDLLAGAMSVTPERIDLVRGAGLVISEVRPPDQFVATLQPGGRGVELDPSLPESAVRVVDVSLDHTTVDVDVIETLAPDAATMDLAESKRILGGGAGLSGAPAFADLTLLAARLDASMGATRVITDRGWVGHE